MAKGRSSAPKAGSPAAAARAINAGIAAGRVNTAPTGGGIGVISGTNIGRGGAYNGWYFKGSLDEVALWNRAISGTEVTSLYNSDNGRQYPFTTTNIKSINGLAYASIKSINGLAIASVKSFNGLA